MPDTLHYQPRRQPRPPPLKGYGDDNDAVVIVLVLALVMLGINAAGLVWYGQNLIVEAVATVGLFIFPVPNTTGLMIVIREFRHRRTAFRLLVLIVAAAAAASTLVAWFRIGNILLEQVPH